MAEPRDLDETDLSALLDVAAAVRSMQGQQVSVSLWDGATGWFFARFCGQLAQPEAAEDHLKIAFESEAQELVLYGDLVNSAWADDETVHIDYRGGDVEISILR